MSSGFIDSIKKNPTSAKARPPLLIIDDDFDTCDLVCTLLARDYDCDAAYDGQQAIEKIRTRLYAVIIADLMMPMMDGFEILKCAASVAPSTPVIILTAIAGENINAMNLGAFDYIEKPFDVEQVENSVRLALSHYQKLQARP